MHSRRRSQHRSTRVTLLASSVALGMFAWMGAQVGTADSEASDRRDPSLFDAPTLAADPTDPLVDSDGDLLPDALEWVTLSDANNADTDVDSFDDFLEAIDHQVPASAYSRAVPTDHMARVLCYEATDGQGVESVYFALLVRGVGTSGTLRGFSPYLHSLRYNFRVPIMALVQAGSLSLRTRQVDGEQHTVFIARLSRSAALRPFLPAVIGADVDVGSVQHNTATYLETDNTGEHVVAMLPVGGADFILHPLEDESRDAMWSWNKVCTLELSNAGRSGGNRIAGVRSADCTVANGLTCVPDCAGNRNRIVVFPDGPSTITGR